MSQHRPLDWEAVQTVVAVARHRTVRGAARALMVHHTTVGRRIEQLEASLGTRLFERHPEGYALTAAGERLVDSGQRFADDLIDVRRRIAGEETALTGTVTLTLAEPVAIELFAPRLAEFASEHPQLDLHLIPTFDFLDLARHEADVAVRMDNDPPQSLVGKRLFAYRQAVYGNPRYLEAHDLVARPAEGRWLGWEPSDDPHPLWTQDTEFAEVPVRGSFPTVMLQQAVARAGLGLTILPCILGDADPDLVRASECPPNDSRSVWVLTHPDLRRTARVRAVMAFAERVLRDAEARFLGVTG